MNTATVIWLGIMAVIGVVMLVVKKRSSNRNNEEA